MQSRAVSLLGQLPGVKRLALPASNPAQPRPFEVVGIPLPEPGLHVVKDNAGEATWYDVASRVFTSAGRGALLSPCATSDYPTPARRPAWSVLDGARLREAGGARRPWSAARDDSLAAIRALS